MSASSRVWGRQGDLNTREAGRSRENCAGAICTPRQRRRSGDFVAEVNTRTRIGNLDAPGSRSDDSSRESRRDGAVARARI